MLREREALDFIESLEAYRWVPETMDALGTAFQMVLAKRWPAEWFSLYTEKNYDRVDPTVPMCRQTMYGFERIRRLLDQRPVPPAVLTPREREVIAWASQGKSAGEIGEILKITQRTAEEHLATAARKLGAVNRTHAVAIAIRHKLINPEASHWEISQSRICLFSQRVHPVSEKTGIFIIHLISAANRHLCEDVVEQHFRLPHEIFVEERNWEALRKPDGREIDLCDNEDRVRQVVPRPGKTPSPALASQPSEGCNKVQFWCRIALAPERYCRYRFCPR
jgi:DNA-binding CsgD family transcriptional regulator